jgi:dipeptidyl aminopeptidase/acylaminoacyl peptidase
VSVDDGRVEEKTPVTREVASGSASLDASKFALVLGSPQRPCVLAVYDAAKGELRELHDPNAAVFETSKLGNVEEIWVPSFDGTKIRRGSSSAVVRSREEVPIGARNPRRAAHRIRHGLLSPSSTLLAEAGYVVLYPNPRGSTTYGQGVRQRDPVRLPGRRLQGPARLRRARDRARLRRPNRIGITGGSGGGLLTNWAITQTHRFKAAITQRCVSEWESFWYSADFTQFNNTWFRNAPFEGDDGLPPRSPCALGSKIETPLLVLHSEETGARRSPGRGDVPRADRAEEDRGHGALPGRGPRTHAQRRARRAASRTSS